MIGEPCESPVGFNDGRWRLVLEYRILRTAVASEEAFNVLGLRVILGDCRRMTLQESASYETPIGVLHQYISHNLAVGGEILFFGESEPTVVYWGEVKYPREMRLMARRGSDWYWCRDARCIAVIPLEKAWSKQRATRVDVHFFRKHFQDEELGFVGVIKEQKLLNHGEGKTDSNSA